MSCSVLVCCSVSQNVLRTMRVVPSRNFPRTWTWVWVRDEKMWRHSTSKSMTFFLELGTNVTISSHRHINFLGSAWNKSEFENLARSWVLGSRFSNFGLERPWNDLKLKWVAVCAAVAVCCSVLHCVAVCCSVRCSVSYCVAVCRRMCSHYGVAWCCRLPTGLDLFCKSLCKDQAL